MTTVTIGEGTGTTYPGEADTNTFEQSPYASNNSNNVMFVYSATAGQRRRGLMVFPGLSNISAGISSVAAELQLRAAYADGSVTLNMHRILVPWTVLDTSWNERLAGVGWTSNGGFNPTDVDMTPVASFPITPSTEFFTIYANSALNALVAGWVNGTIPNYGVMLVRSDDTAYDGVLTQIYGGITPASVSRPLLTVTYSTAPSGPSVSSITIGSVTEGGAASVSVALSAATTASTTFACGLVGVTAGSGDLTLSLNGVTCTNGVTCDGTNFTVPSGVSGWSFNIQTTADALDEVNETATLTIGGTSATLTITDNDAQPGFSINDSTQVGGVVTFTVTLSAASGKTCTVRVDTVNGTKVDGTDFTAVVNLVLSFAPGETSKTFDVTVL